VFFHQVSAFPRCCVAALRNPAVRAFQHPQHGYAGGGAGWPVWYISVLAGYGGGVGGDELFDYGWRFGEAGGHGHAEVRRSECRRYARDLVRHGARQAALSVSK